MQSLFLEVFKGWCVLIMVLLWSQYIQESWPHDVRALAEGANQSNERKLLIKKKDCPCSRQGDQSLNYVIQTLKPSFRYLLQWRSCLCIYIDILQLAVTRPCYNTGACFTQSPERPVWNQVIDTVGLRVASVLTKSSTYSLLDVRDPMSLPVDDITRTVLSIT